MGFKHNNPEESPAVSAIGRSKLLRLQQIVAPEGPLPIGKSTWWLGVKAGRFPQPIKLGPKITVWRENDIADLIATGFCNITKTELTTKG